MQICVKEHLTSVLHVQYEGEADTVFYKIEILDAQDNLVLERMTSKTDMKIHHVFPTGFYKIRIHTVRNVYQIFSIVPAICRLSTGDCGCLVYDGQRTMLITAFHCINKKEHAKDIVCYFETMSVRLEPDVYWAYSDRYKFSGLDYCCIGFREESILHLKEHYIIPHLLTKEEPNTNIGILCHFNFQHGHSLLRSVCSVHKKNQNTLFYQYEEHFVPSSAGSSGSPLFGICDDHVFLLGIHVGKHNGKGKCTTVKSI